MTAASTVSDGELVLTLELADEGGYVVTSPLDPELITEAESLVLSLSRSQAFSRLSFPGSGLGTPWAPPLQPFSRSQAPACERPVCEAPPPQPPSSQGANP